MIKRLKYVSRSSTAMTDAEVAEIGRVSAEDNLQRGITGVLVEASGVFFQVIEGPTEAVDHVFAQIRRDPRHREVLLLNTMLDCESRMFPDWAMKTVRVGNDDVRAEAIKLLLETAIEARNRVATLSSGIERIVWGEVVSR
jgi:hypothetical protein